MLTYYLGLGSNKQEVRLWQWNCTVLNHSWFTSCILSLLHKFILSILSVILRCKSKVIITYKTRRYIKSKIIITDKCIILLRHLLAKVGKKRLSLSFLNKD